MTEHDQVLTGSKFLRVERHVKPSQERIAGFDHIGCFCPRLHGNRPHDGKQVLHAMPCFGDDELLLGVVSLPLRHVVEDDKDVRAIVIGMDEKSCVDEKGSLADRWKSCLTS
ncbi:hypothetical protein GGE67_005881 [Rhizobium leucaenae]|uniref:Uncharacterized protein n=1 Tax=Rhizobium leucaenae TaxID=29450 RepID=A0A7W7A049_9HYPH|nr:hypothetical protein [Rhizobium leucaenae]MBB4571363.1 hypothetical protein [Rhizobium leucaenae]MBB6305215.1 hypothetical protein [Rhizobium leucaenae]